MNVVCRPLRDLRRQRLVLAGHPVNPEQAVGRSTVAGDSLTVT
jgi:hypothetical protein